MSMALHDGRIDAYAVPSTDSLRLLRSAIHREDALLYGAYLLLAGD